MLALSRRSGESVSIGGICVVTVGVVSGDKVRLKFEAPKELVILRTELDPPEACVAAASLVSACKVQVAALGIAWEAVSGGVS